MITSHIMMPTFRKDSLFQSVEDSFTLTEVARYDFDLGLEVGELIKISNITSLSLELDYIVEARVKNKSKILKEERIIVDEVEKAKFIVRIEYVVEFENKKDLDTSYTGQEKSFLSSDSDLFLMELVELAYQDSITIPITLFVQGIVVKGWLSNENWYFVNIRKHIKKAISIYPTDESRVKFLDSFREGRKLRNQEFIYLSSAEIQFGNSRTRTTDWGFWRGRLSHVDGFLLGHVTNESSFSLEDEYWNDEAYNDL
ncbi:hypothetical protein [Microcoleus sp. S13_C5]|uniref:hypothetical protein n=1 Tax=Microcoleus sp. S13_C5 TaxID=3055411 RepID=UPI002FD44296